MTENTPFAAIQEQFDAMASENETLRESLDQVMASLRFEDRNWKLIGQFLNGDETEGFTLEQVKEISQKIRPRIVGSSLVGRGVALHAGYVFSKGVNIDGTEKPTGRGRPSRARALFLKAVNQESVFSSSAHIELQKCRYSDGMVVALCDIARQEIRVIPLSEISGVKVNPEFPSEIWAYQRSWVDPSRPDTTRVEWIYTNRFSGVKQKSYSSNGQTIPVRPNAVIVDRQFNSQKGWVLGAPDAVAALPWIEAYSEFLSNGRVVTESLARILYKVTSKTKNGAANAAAKIANMSGHGNTASMLEGNELNAIQTAGRGYDFKSGDRIASMAATSLNVPLIELLADSAAAGSSYGAAQSLSPTTRNAMRMIQDEWISFYEELFEAFGIERPKVWFDPIDDPDPYRSAQQLTLLSPPLTNEEYRAKALDLLDIVADASIVPPTLAARSAAATQAASPDQGRSNGAGDVAAASDLRTDNTIGETLNLMNLDRLQELVERLETAQR